MTMMKLGSSGRAVQELQQQLAQLGYKLKGTGYFGPATDTAVSHFQRTHNLKDDGEVGPQTKAAIDKAILEIDGSVAKPKAEVTRPLWLIEALKWVGTKENLTNKDNPQIIEWAHEEGGQIAKTYTHDSIPWCALFANMVLTKVGLKGTETLWALDFAGHWPSTKLPYPAVGAFAPMKRTGGGHIMVIVGKDAHGNIVGVGGNQSDAVNIRSFPLARLNQGYWWPKGVSMPDNFDLPIVRADGTSVKEG